MTRRPTKEQNRSAIGRFSSGRLARPSNTALPGRQPVHSSGSQPPITTACFRRLSRVYCELSNRPRMLRTVKQKRSCFLEGYVLKHARCQRVSSPTPITCGDRVRKFTVINETHTVPDTQTSTQWIERVFVERVPVTTDRTARVSEHRRLYRIDRSWSRSDPAG